MFLIPFPLPPNLLFFSGGAVPVLVRVVEVCDYSRSLFSPFRLFLLQSQFFFFLGLLVGKGRVRSLTRLIFLFFPSQGSPGRVAGNGFFFLPFFRLFLPTSLQRRRATNPSLFTRDGVRGKRVPMGRFLFFPPLFAQFGPRSC